jgi:hypothetical protein
MRWRPLVGFVLVVGLALASIPIAGTGDSSGSPLGYIKIHYPNTSVWSVTDIVGSELDETALVATGGGEVISWDLRWAKADRVKLPSSVRVMDVSYVNHRYYAVDEGGTIRWLSVEPLKVQWSKSVMNGIVRTVAVSQDQEYMAIVGLLPGVSMGITVLQMSTLNSIPYWSEGISGDFANITPKAATWIPPGSLTGISDHTLVVGDALGLIYLWNGNGNARFVTDLGSAVVGLGWHEDQGELVAATKDGILHLVDVATGLSTWGFPTSFQGTIQLVCFDMLDDLVAVGGSNGHVELWDMGELTRTQMLRFYDLTCGDVGWVNETHLLTSNVYGRLVLWGPDLDEDGVGNALDAFPGDPLETRDSDGDGFGDNGDRFPINPEEWWDSDGDGFGDNGDPFPKDSSEWADSDGDGIGNNGDFLPQMHNTMAIVLLIAVVGLAGVAPVARLTYVRRKKRHDDRMAALDWMGGLELEPIPNIGTKDGKQVLDKAFLALRVRSEADPTLLSETVNARDTTVLNLMVALRVQEEIVARGGVGADAAMARVVQLRDQLQELDDEREKLDSISHGFWEVQDRVDGFMKENWPDLDGLHRELRRLMDRIQLLENSLAQFRAGSLIRIGEEAAKISRGAFVVASKDVGIKGSPRAHGVKVGVPPRPEIVPPPQEEGDRTPLAVTPPHGRLRTRQAMLVLEATAELIVSVDNTLAEDLEELAIQFTIAGDLLRHKGPHRVELGTLRTGRSTAATFQMRIAPSPDPEDEPGELTRVMARVSAVSGSSKVLHELPARTTTLVSSTLQRPSDWSYRPLEDGLVGRRGVRFPQIPSAYVLESLEFPHGLLPLMDGDLPGGGTWRMFATRTEEGTDLLVALAVVPGPEWVEVLVEVRCQKGFPARELAEEIVDGLRFSILSDRRLRLRGEDKSLSRDRIDALAKMMAETYIGHPSKAHGAGREQGEVP